MPPTFAAFVSHERFVVAESNDRVVGFGGLKVATKEVDALFVSPDFAGQGLGARLLAWVEDAALSLGIDAVTLKASLNSVPFYLQAGYFSGAAGTHVTANGTAIPCLHMEKSLGANHAVV